MRCVNTATTQDFRVLWLAKSQRNLQIILIRVKNLSFLMFIGTFLCLLEDECRMKTLEYVKNHIDEFERDNFFDERFTRRFLDFIEESEWEKFGFKRTGNFEKQHKPKEWTEENVLRQLKDDVDFGIEKAEVFHLG